jgi:peptidoglycan-associated lipoprotein
VILLAGCASHNKPLPLEAPRSPPPAPPQVPTNPYVAPAPPAVESQVLPGTQRDFVVNVGDRVYFDFNSYLTRPDGARVLERQASWLIRYPPVRVRIEGNCDERGTEEYNFALGARRASEVKGFLIEHGVDMSRITTVSYGKTRPIDPGTGEEAWAHNRNAHTAITEGTR